MSKGSIIDVMKCYPKLATVYWSWRQNEVSIQSIAQQTDGETLMMHMKR